MRSLIVTNSADTPRETCPTGSFDACLITMLDLGLQEGLKGDLKRSVWLAWEIHALQSNGEPFVIGREFTVSLHPKSNLGQLLMGWRGKAFGDAEEFDLADLLGKFCQVNVVHKHVPQPDGTLKTYANIDGGNGQQERVQAA